ncbi:MAG: glycosyl hydrolase [Trueperaceae bacterium]
MTAELEAPTTFTQPLMGAFVPTGFWSDLAAFKELEGTVGGEFDIGHWYTSWSHDYDPIPVNDLLQHGRIPLVSWQSQVPSVADIAAGLHDDYVRQWARQAAQAPGVLYVRPFPEMNGDWAPWYGDPENLKLAWRRLVTLFREEGASNVKWVFSPNVTDEPRTEVNRMENYYPGTEYVDVLALDGYNWGSTRPYIGWQSFDQVFAGGYERITALGPQPVWIPEVASTEHGGDKAAWITDMLSSTTFDRLEAIVWFNEDKETDWRIESSHASAEAFRQWFEWREWQEAPGGAAAAPQLAGAPVTR